MWLLWPASYWFWWKYFAFMSFWKRFFFFWIFIQVLQPFGFSETEKEFFSSFACKHLLKIFSFKQRNFTKQIFFGLGINKYIILKLKQTFSFCKCFYFSQKLFIYWKKGFCWGTFDQIQFGSFLEVSTAHLISNSSPNTTKLWN